MKQNNIALKITLPLIFFLIICVWVCSVHAVPNQTSPFIAIIKINDLENILFQIDDLMAGKSQKQGISPTGMLKGFLQGTDWIDPVRHIVIGLENPAEFSMDTPPVSMAFIPFIEPNENFRAAYNARTGPGYYILPLPPGADIQISKASETALRKISNSKPEKSLMIEISIEAILKQHRSKIDQAIKNAKPPQNNQQINGSTFKKPDFVQTANSLLEIFEQLASFGLSLDFNSKNIELGLHALAEKGTQIDHIFRPGQTSLLLSKYIPEGAISFMSGSYDIEAVSQLARKSFGKFYEEEGTDFESLISISKNFTGELAGGISYQKQHQMIIEMLSVLKKQVDQSNFIEKTYLPWLLEYGHTMSGPLAKQEGSTKKTVQPFSRTSDSNVLGHKVVGINSSFPFLAFGKDVPTDLQSANNHLVEYSARLAIVDNLFIIAPNDIRMKELILTVKSLKEDKVQGFTSAMKIDLSAYLSNMQDFFEKEDYNKIPLPDVGNIRVTSQMNKGRSHAAITVKKKDIAKLSDYMMRLKAADKFRDNDKKKIKKNELRGKKSVKNNESPEKKEAIFLREQGRLCSTYGNDKAAVIYYKKALELDPLDVSAIFNMGISYGELGDYSKALSFINQAIKLKPSQAEFYYGRGRVYLLSGEKSKAMQDFNLAAQSGSQDALEYIQQIKNDK